MCSEHHADEIMICDVAIADVTRALAVLDGISIELVPYQGHLVRNAAPAQRAAFRRRINDAIAPHGGALGEAVDSGLTGRTGRTGGTGRADPDPAIPSAS